MYADYSFYVNEYLIGLDATIPEREFSFYSNMATADVRNVIRLDMIDSEPTIEMKMATCEIAELLYRMDDHATTSASENGSNGIPIGISSEKVGEYSVTYSGNTEAERAESKNNGIRTIVKKWLGPAGLLFRGIC